MKRYCLLVIALLALSVQGFGQSQTVTGSITATDSVCRPASCVLYVLPTTGNVGTVSVQITGSYTATLSFYMTVDGVNFVLASGAPIGSSTTVTSTASNGIWLFSTPGILAVRVLCTAFVSGTASVTMQASSIPAGGSGSGGGGGGGGAVTVLDGVDNTIIASVKAASTASIATDKAIVVAASPNSPQKITGTDGSSLVGSTDPCQIYTKVYASFSLTANGVIVSGTAATRTYPCQFYVSSNGVETVALVSGHGSTCGTGTAGLFGAATAAAGWSFPSGFNGVAPPGDGGFAIQKTVADSDDICILKGGSTQINGNIVYVQH